MMQTHHTPGCSGKEIDWFRVTDVNRRINANEFCYVHCKSCGLLRLDNVPENLGGYYTSDYYALPTLGELINIAKSNPLKINTIKKFKEGGKLLEIGPAYGVFAFQAKQAGFEVDVIEMDARCCEYLNQVVGVHVVCSMQPHDAMESLGQHDVIALWHVIEHLPEPWALMKSAADNLTLGGILVLAAPNPESWQFKIMKEKWPHLDAPRHLYLFPEQVLTDFAESLGLERIYYTTTDSDAKSWNRFGWQKFFMNKFSGRWLQRICFVVGYLLSFFMDPFENTDNKGSAYTLVFCKKRDSTM